LSWRLWLSGRGWSSRLEECMAEWGRCTEFDNFQCQGMEGWCQCNCMFRLYRSHLWCPGADHKANSCYNTMRTPRLRIHIRSHNRQKCCQPDKLVLDDHTCWVW
jgi:hypothetical protein